MTRENTVGDNSDKKKKEEFGNNYAKNVEAGIYASIAVGGAFVQLQAGETGMVVTDVTTDKKIRKARAKAIK